MEKLNRLLLKTKPTLLKPKLKKKKRTFFKKKRSFRRRLPPITQEELLNYKNLSVISQFISKQGKILPRWVKGLKKKKQDLVTRAVKQARILALLSFHASEKLFHVSQSEIPIEKKYRSSPKKTKLWERKANRLHKNSPKKTKLWERKPKRLQKNSPSSPKKTKLWETKTLQKKSRSSPKKTKLWERKTIENKSSSSPPKNEIVGKETPVKEIQFLPQKD